MPEEEKSGSDEDCSGRRARFTDSGRVITYKRRRRSSPCLGGVLKGLSVVSSEGQKATNVSHLLKDGSRERHYAGIQRRWKAILEETVLPEDLDNSIISSCVQKALASLCEHYLHKENGKAEKVNSLSNTVCAAKAQQVAISELRRSTGVGTNNCLDSDQCQNVLSEVLVSVDFAMLCNLLLGNIPGIKATGIINFSRIDPKVKTETNGQSIGCFHEYLQQIWERIRRIGEEMVLLANSLSQVSNNSFQKQSPEGCAVENSDGSHTTTQIPCEPEAWTKRPEQSGASCMYKISICKKCGTEADGKCSLICDGCESPYHFSCVKPANLGIPTRSWYCATYAKGSAEPDATVTHEDQDYPHEDCAVCGLKALGAQERPVWEKDKNNFKEGSSSGGPLRPSKRTASSRLCKICGKTEEANGKFIVCAHDLCLYRYYHNRCLGSSQVETRHGCWYCPSCLCRACLKDKDDDMIVMCDGCDEGYHTYCMNPPRTSVPEGRWYCHPCNVRRAKEGMKRFEQWVLRQHGQCNGLLSSGSR